MNEKNVNVENNEVSQADSIKGCLLLVIIAVVGLFIFFKSCNSCSSDSDSNNGGGDWPRKCEQCGKMYDKDDTYYGTIYGRNEALNHRASSDYCAKCSFKYQDRAEREWWKNQVKKGRNKWVDENPQEAKRRGIRKF